MSDREMVMDPVARLPADTPMREIARAIELVADKKAAREQARKEQGIPAEDARILIYF